MLSLPLIISRRFGYSLSHFVAEGKIKHYMIDQTPEGNYSLPPLICRGAFSFASLAG